MGKVGYSSFKGVGRLKLALKGPEETSRFAVEVLRCHAALEIEMDEFLNNALHNAAKLKAGGLGFGHKIALVNACWKGEPQSGDKLANALVKFNDLRNGVAHGDHPNKIEKSFAKLKLACAAFDDTLSDMSTAEAMAVSICSFMGDDQSGKQLDKLLKDLNFEIVKVL